MVGQTANDVPDHMHIVCHSEGCAEVKARLAAIGERQKVAQQKLDECSRTRKQLAADLAAAAKSRGKAEAALAQCATERASSRGSCGSVPRLIAQMLRKLWQSAQWSDQSSRPN